MSLACERLHVRMRRAALLLAALLTGAVPAQAAEITGRVEVQMRNLLGARVDGAELIGGVSVAAIPLDGQAVDAIIPSTHRIAIRDKMFDPVFVTARTGDALVIENNDQVLHEVFSLSKVLPFNLRLGKPGDISGADVRQIARMPGPGTWHLFCRINNRMYARVDVVDTPYVQMLPHGGEFSFAGLPGGRWRLRVAALGSEVMHVDTVAITAPPPLRIELAVKGAGAQAAGARKVGYDWRAAASLYPIADDAGSR